jgi:hypothetical protein
LRGALSTTTSGTAVIARTAEWLRAREGANGVVARVAQPQVEGGADGLEISNKPERSEVNGPKAQNRHLIDRPRDAESSIEPGAPNGSVRLTPRLRERLAFILEHDPNSIRRGAAGVGIEAARVAADGANIEVAIANRLVEFLENG